MSSSGDGLSSVDQIFVHTVFGADNVAKLLAELETEEHRAAAMESLVREAVERLGDEPFHAVSAMNISFLRNLLERFRGPEAVARVEFVEEPFQQPAFLQPFDAAQVGAEQAAAAVQGMVIQQAAGVEQQEEEDDDEEEYMAAWRKLMLPFVAPKEMALRQQVVELEQKPRQSQQMALQYNAALGHLPLPQPQMMTQQQDQEATARKLLLQDMMGEIGAAFEGVTKEDYVAGGWQHRGEAQQDGTFGLTGGQDMTMMQQQQEEVIARKQVLLQDLMDEIRAASEGVTKEVYVAGGRKHSQAQKYGTMGLTRGQDTTMMQQQQQYANMELNVTLGHDHPNLQQQQAGRGVRGSVHGSGPGAATMPLQPGGPSANAPPLFVQQLQNDGGEEVESSSDPGAHCSSSTPYPDAPSDDK